MGPFHGGGDHRAARRRFGCWWVGDELADERREIPGREPGPGDQRRDPTAAHLQPTAHGLTGRVVGAKPRLVPDHVRRQARNDAHVRALGAFGQAQSFPLLGGPGALKRPAGPGAAVGDEVARCPAVQRKATTWAGGHALDGRHPGMQERCLEVRVSSRFEPFARCMMQSGPGPTAQESAPARSRP